MHHSTNRTTTAPDEAEPAWDVALLFPRQGHWSPEDYLELDTNRQVELTNGRIEVLPLPTMSHQLVALYLYRLLLGFVTANNLGMVLAAAMPVRVRPGKFREPDVLFMSAENADRMGNKYWKGADLVMEVVSEGTKNRRRDLQSKRKDYAQGRIQEYWIVDPQTERITVLRLSGKQYVVHGEFAKGTLASSHLLPGFTVDVTEALGQRFPKSPAAKVKTKSPRKKSNGKK